jgi:ParB/RepB/Spo0J family partition protein
MTKRPPTPDILADLLGAPGERVQLIALAALDSNPYQHRSNAIADDDPAMLELVASVQANGILQPLIVRTHCDPAQRGRYQIGAGHRRLSAARLAGLDSAPCIVRPLSDDDMLDVVVAENYHRSDVNPIDRAQLFQILADRGLTHAQIAERFAISRPTVSNALRLLQLPEVVRAEVVAGAITNRQAEALLPLATLPPEAEQNAPSYATRLPTILNYAKTGMASDRLREVVSASVQEHTKELPEHWASRDFGDLAGVVSPRCADCTATVQTKHGLRCPNAPCWALKSSSWQAIEHAKAVAQSGGVPILPEGVDYNRRTPLYSNDRDLLHLPEPPNAPPAPVCPNLRLKLGYQGKVWDWVCYHPDKKFCQCVRKANRELTKDGAAAWQQVRAQTTAALAARLATWPVEALRTACYIFDGAFGPTASKRAAMTADDAIAYLAAKLIERAEPSEPAKWPDRACADMAALLAIAGVRAPWLPPLSDIVAGQLAEAQDLVDTFVDPGDGLPTQEGIDKAFAALDGAAHTLQAIDTDLATYQDLSRRHADLYARLAALSDRAETSRQPHQ